MPRELTAPEFVIALILIVVTLLGMTASVVAFIVYRALIYSLIISSLKSFVSWVIYLFDDRTADLPDYTKGVADPFVRRRRQPQLRRDPAVRARAARAIMSRRRRQRRVFGFLVLGIMLLVPAFVGFNIWIDVLAERRTIRVNHETSDGTGNLPRILSGDMTIVTDGRTTGSDVCSVTLRWLRSGTEQFAKRTILDPGSVDIREVLRSEGIRDSPHYDHYPVSLTTTGCKPWRIEIPG